jgi:hypothetical protein
MPVPSGWTYLEAELRLRLYLLLLLSEAMVPGWAQSQRWPTARNAGYCAKLQRAGWQWLADAVARYNSFYEHSDQTTMVVTRHHWSPAMIRRYGRGSGSDGGSGCQARPATARTKDEIQNQPTILRPAPRQFLLEPRSTHLSSALLSQVRSSSKKSPPTPAAASPIIKH